MSLQVRDLLLLDFILLLMGVETAGGVMTKFIVRNTTVLMALNSDVHAERCQPTGSPLLRTCSLSLVDRSDVIGPFSARLHEAPCRWQLFFLHLFAVDSLDVLILRNSSVRFKKKNMAPVTALLHGSQAPVAEYITLA